MTLGMAEGIDIHTMGLGTMQNKRVMNAYQHAATDTQ